MSEKWNIEELKQLEKEKDELLKNLAQSLIKDHKTIFSAKFGFGSPPMDIIEVKDDYTKRAYTVKLPLSDGKFSSLPYYQGFGEAVFFLDQMVEQSYLMIPDIEVKDLVPFLASINSIKRWKKMTSGVGLVTFDKSYNLKKLKEAGFPTAKKFIRLELELVDIILKYGEIEVRPDKEPKFKAFKKWAKRELDSIGDKIIMAEEYARVISQKILRDEGMYGPTMELSEDEVESRPYPIPIFVVEGEGNYLGDNKRYRLLINRITGNIIEKSFK